MLSRWGVKILPTGRGTVGAHAQQRCRRGPHTQHTERYSQDGTNDAAFGYRFRSNLIPGGKEFNAAPAGGHRQVYIESVAGRLRQQQQPSRHDRCAEHPSLAVMRTASYFSQSPTGRRRVTRDNNRTSS